MNVINMKKYFNDSKSKLVLSPIAMKNKVTLVYGSSGIGKSRFVFDCAYAAATKSDFLIYSSWAKAKVLYIDGHMIHAQLTCRIDNNFKRHDLRCANFHYYFVTEADRILMLEKMLEDKEIKPQIYESDFIILDSIQVCCPEFSIEYALKFARNLAKQNKAVMIVATLDDKNEQDLQVIESDLIDHLIKLDEPRPSQSNSVELMITHFKTQIDRCYLHALFQDNNWILIK
jgi:archaellum biogenesis ATPase FlaH